MKVYVNGKLYSKPNIVNGKPNEFTLTVDKDDNHLIEAMLDDDYYTAKKVVMNDDTLALIGAVKI